MSSKRVVVTGLGTTSPVGGDVPSTWDALVNGRSGVRHLTDDWAEEMPVKIAGRIAVEPTEVLERVKARRLDRCLAVRDGRRDGGLGRRRPGRRRRSTTTGSASRWRRASAASPRCWTTTTR